MEPLIIDNYALSLSARHIVPRSNTVHRWIQTELEKTWLAQSSCLTEPFLCCSYLHRTGLTELCTPPPYSSMAEETENDIDGGSREGDSFHIATLANEDHYVYM